ncbi:6413_t:CDS:2, partial [Funneliformis geosporum]
QPKLLKTYLGKDVITSYLMKRGDKSSYHGCLAQCRDVVVSLSFSSSNWKDLDNAWATHFLVEAERLDLDQEALKKKMRRIGTFGAAGEFVLGRSYRGMWKEYCETETKCDQRKRKHSITNKKEAQTTLILSEGISLPEVIRNILPNLTYLKLHNKSNSSTESTEKRFPDEITNWVEFEQEVLAWQPEVNKKYQEPTFTSDVNIYETLTPFDRSILFLDGRALESIVGQPDFVIVNGNMILLVVWECKTKWVLKVSPNEDIVTLYNQKKEIREGPFVCSIFDPINQTYGYMCANSLRYGILSTYDQTWVLKMGVEKVEGKDYGWLHVSNTIMCASTNPTLLKSVAYIIDLASND